MLPPPPREWAAGDDVFAAWVPCITGQLSFSLMGEGVSGCVHATGLSPAAERQVIAVQRRVASDLPRPWFWSVWTWASANFALVGQTGPCHRRRAGETWEDKQGVLTGSVFLLQKHSHARGKRRDRLVRSLRQSVANFRASQDSEPLISLAYDDIIAGRTALPIEANTALQIPQAHFALYRSGELRLRLLPETLPERFRDVDGRLIEESQLEYYRAQFEEQLAQHFYYFIRDLAHRHYHHHQETDSLLPLIKSPSSDDLGWRRETGYALGRAALEARRENELLSYKKAEGIVAYGRAFEENLSKNYRPATNFDLEENNPNVHQYDWNALLASMTARSDEEMWRYSGRVQAFAAMLAAGLATIALWFAIAQVSTNLGFSKIDPELNTGILLESSRLLYEKPALALSLVLTATWIAYEIFGRGFRAFAPAQRILEHMRRLGYAIAASASNRLRRSMPELADTLGAYTASFVSTSMMLGFFDLALALARRDVQTSVIWRTCAWIVSRFAAVAASLT